MNPDQPGLSLPYAWEPLEFAKLFGLTDAELQAEIRSGRLVVCGEKERGQWTDLAILPSAAIAWAGHPDTPAILKSKWRSAMQRAAQLSRRLN